MDNNSIIVAPISEGDFSSIRSMLCEAKDIDSVGFEYLHLSEDIHISEFFSDKSYVYGAWDENKLVGYSSMSLEGISSHIMSDSLNLSINRLSKCAILERSYVLPNYRGGLIHRRFIEQRELDALTENFDYVIAQVKSDNIFSLRNFTLLGYECRFVRPGKDGTRNSHFLMKSLNNISIG